MKKPKYVMKWLYSVKSISYTTLPDELFTYSVFTFMRHELFLTKDIFLDEIKDKFSNVITYYKIIEYALANQTWNLDEDIEPDFLIDFLYNSHRTKTCMNIFYNINIDNLMCDICCRTLKQPNKMLELSYTYWNNNFDVLLYLLEHNAKKLDSNVVVKYCNEIIHGKIKPRGRDKDFGSFYYVKLILECYKQKFPIDFYCKPTLFYLYQSCTKLKKTIKVIDIIETKLKYPRRCLYKCLSEYTKDCHKSKLIQHLIDKHKVKLRYDIFNKLTIWQCYFATKFKNLFENIDERWFDKIINETDCDDVDKNKLIKKLLTLTTNIELKNILEKIDETKIYYKLVIREAKRRIKN